MPLTDGLGSLFIPLFKALGMRLSIYGQRQKRVKLVSSRQLYLLVWSNGPLPCNCWQRLLEYQAYGIVYSNNILHSSKSSWNMLTKLPRSKQQTRWGSFHRIVLCSLADLPEFIAASASILSSPLPANVALPASTSAFFEHLLERMVESLTIDNIRMVHQAMSSLSTTFLDLVPATTFERFASTCNDILRTNQDHVQNMLCLGIYVLAAKEYQCLPGGSLASSYLGSPPSSQVREWRENISTFFSADKAFPTTSFTVLRVALFCSLERQFSVQEALDCILLGIQIIRKIEPATLCSWVSKNRAVAERLQAKLSRPDLELEIRFAVRGLTFQVLLLDMTLMLNRASVSMSRYFNQRGYLLRHVHWSRKLLDPYVVPNEALRRSRKSTWSSCQSS